MNLSQVPVVILAGGRGARFDHESQVLPKPLIEVAGKPILRHIIDSLVVQGFREFIVATGYLGEKVVEYFQEQGSCFAYDRNIDRYHFRLGSADDPVFVKCWDTGRDSHTGERVYRLQDAINNRRFVLTYGDGLSDVDMAKVMELHERDSRDMKVWWGSDRPEESVPALITVTSVRPPARFGAIEFTKIDDWGVGEVRSFQEKPQDAWINGGFMVVEPRFIGKYLEDDWGTYKLESEAMAACALHGFMRAYRHTGYWQCMDTRRDLEQIESDVAGNGGKLPWARSG